MPPEEKRQSRKENKRGGGALQCSHHCSGISPLHCDGQALPQVGEGLGFPGGLFEMATQFSQERESLWSKRACRLDGHRCEDVVLVDFIFKTSTSVKTLFAGSKVLAVMGPNVPKWPLSSQCV